MKILNLYAGIGGNRKLWPQEDITAIEINPKIAKIYQDFFPSDKVIVADAHQFLLDHFEEFDFIWSSPPCPSHSRARLWGWKNDSRVKKLYPDMKLYEEIIFLQNFGKKIKWIIENVIAYYQPLIEPQKIGRHYFWSNFMIRNLKHKTSDINRGTRKQWEELTGLSIKGKDVGQRSDRILRNCVEPELGLHIFQEAFREYKTLF